MRPVLAQRLADGMKAAWEATRTTLLKAADVDAGGPGRATARRQASRQSKIAELLRNQGECDRRDSTRRGQLAFSQRCEKGGYHAELSCLIGSVDVVHMPGELFVEYQLAAQACARRFVCMAAYGDYGPGYIGTAVAYREGGYETQPQSTHVAPAVENVLLGGLRELLK